MVHRRPSQHWRRVHTRLGIKPVLVNEGVHYSLTPQNLVKWREASRLLAEAPVNMELRIKAQVRADEVARDLGADEGDIDSMRQAFGEGIQQRGELILAETTADKLLKRKYRGEEE